MFFHSLSSLLIFLPVFFIVYPILKRINSSFSNIFLLFFSLIFYAFDIPWFVIPLLISAFSDYFLSKFLIENNLVSNKFKIIPLVLSISINLGLLLIFKYHDLINLKNFTLPFFFYEENLNYKFLPIGISFYTFQTLSFSIDSFKGDIKKTPKLIDYLLYVCYFPQLVAGPILRANNFFDSNSNLLLNKKWPNINNGFYRICYGLFLKLCLADELSRLNDIAFNSDPNILGFFDSWTMAFGFGLQIYFDFSAYSHMAIGISALIGLPIKENFNFPYNSKSVTEFWRRWHISLSSWVSDYLYKNFKNNFSNKFYGLIPILFTWVIMGMWHGSSWRFAIWGLLNGCFILIHRLYKSIFKRFDNKILTNLYWLFTLFSIMSTWIYFRSTTWNQANILFLKLFKFEGFSLSFRENYYLFVFLFTIFCIVLGNSREYIRFEKLYNSRIFNIILSSFALALSLIFINRQNSFIYFQF